MGSVGVEGGGWRRGEDVMGSAVMEGGVKGVGGEGVMGLARVGCGGGRWRGKVGQVGVG